MSSLVMKVEEMSKLIDDISTKRLAYLLHFIIYEARNAQIFHRLRISVNDVGAFSDVIAISLKDYNKLKEDEKLKEAALNASSTPSEEDVRNAQKFFLQYGKDYTKILLARASAPCFKGRCKVEGG
jgi:pyruvate kinase